MLDRRSNIDSPHRNTCRWISDLDEYKTWVSRSSGLLWVKGKPGAGKSTLMSYLYRLMSNSPGSNREIFLEFFFSARGVPLQRTPLGMLRSLLNQIFSKDHSIRDTVRKPYQEKCNSFGSSEKSWEWQQAELEDILKNTILSSSQRRQLVIFVDALDESGPQAAMEVARYFHAINDSISQSSLTAKICMSCRHYPVPSSKKAVEISVEEYNYHDIKSYVYDQIVIENLNFDNAINLSDRRNLANLIVEAARGVFQWVRLIVPMVERYFMEGDSATQITEWLTKVPAELERVYQHILESVIDHRHRAKSLRLFQWVCLATRPLTVKELRYALAAGDLSVQLPQIDCEDTPDFITTDAIMRSRIKPWSGGLIEIVKRKVGCDDEVQVMHQSVNDFYRSRGARLFTLLNGREYDRSLAILTPSDTPNLLKYYHGDMYWSCLKYISVARARLEGILPTEFENVNSLPKGADRFIDWDEKKKISKCIMESHPLAEYAAKSALIHAMQAQDRRGQDLEEEVNVLEHIIPWWTYLRLALPQTELDHPFQPFEPGATALHIAAAADLGDLVRYILSRGIDVDATNKRKQSALQIAVGNRSYTSAEILVNAGANIQSTDSSSPTALVIAASIGDARLVSWLLKQGASLEASQHDVESPLYTAVSKDQVKIVQLLIEAGANVNAHSGVYGNALQAAAADHSPAETMRLLLNAGADVNTQGGPYGNALQAAVAAKHDHHIDKVRLLLEAGADVHAQSEKCGNALLEAVDKDAIQIVRLLLKAGANVNSQGGYHGIALHTAVYKGAFETVRLLLEAGANVNTQGGLYSNALQAAVRSGKIEMVRLLLEAGANVNAQGGYYGNALQAAAHEGSIDLVRLLLKAGADVNAQGGWFGYALQAAAYYSTVETVRLLLTAGADVNAQGGICGNALQGAAFNGAVETVRLLLEAGADVNAQGGTQGNALLAAVKVDCLAAQKVRSFVKVDADVNAQGGEDGIALQTVIHGDPVETVRLLLKAGADVNSRGEYRGNALQRAVHGGTIETVRLLIEAGADVNAQGGEHGYALQAAVHGGTIEIVRLLLKAGANVNAQGGYHGNALQTAVYKGAFETVRLLLEAGANVNTQGGLYSNALQAAVRSGKIEMVRLLLKAGANVNAQGGRYGNALQAAAHEGSIDLVRLLLEAGANVNAQGGCYGNALIAARHRGHDHIFMLLTKAGAQYRHKR